MRKALVLPLIVLINGCVSFEYVPTSTPIHDDFITLVANDVNLGKQTLYKDEKLKHYKIDGVNAYCSDMFSMNLELYRCFAIDGDMLVQALNPKTTEWDPLKYKVKVIRRPL